MPNVDRRDNSRHTTQPLLDGSEVAARLGVTARTVRELWARGKLSGVKVGRRVRFTEEDLADFIERNRVRHAR